MWAYVFKMLPTRRGQSVHARATESHHAETRREMTEEKARRILHEELDKLS